MTDAHIAFDDVSCVVDDVPILRSVTTRLTARRTAVIGANGSGKSTFARMINGLRQPTSGTVRVLGLDSAAEGARVRSRVGFVFTNPEAQILMPTPAEDLALSLGSVPRAMRATRVEQILEQYGLAGRGDQPVSELSGGQRQLLALAAVLCTDPQLVVADEPTTLLDLRNARRIADLLLGLPVPTVIVTHDLDLAARCDEAVLFDDGRLIAIGAPPGVIETYRRLSA
ncbi:energy-coupling factor ABC transporter ATP-binding protein [Microbacterium sp. NPDC089987]|uniref:energy-coupling factor ABC transporter ATP-binding protein n=1 Tax=Microbacterium sp. NPDC089987 TaxID=3364202 RepID=UPI003828DFA2